MPTGSTAVTCQAQGYTWRHPLDRTTTESAHGHMIAHHHPCTQRRHPPFAPQREHTQKGASVPRGPGFRLLSAQAPCSQCPTGGLAQSGRFWSMKTPFLGHFVSSTAWVAQTQHACTMKTNTGTAEKYTPASPNTRAHSLWCVSSPPVRESLTKRALSSRRHSATKKRKSNPRRPRLPGVQKKRAQG